MRVNVSTKVKLDKIQSKTGLSQLYLLERAVDLLVVDMHIRQLESDFADLVEDAASLAKYQEASASFDGA